MSEFTRASQKIKHFVHFKFHRKNEYHQSDLVFMPNDNGFKYILTIIDGYTRYGVGIAMKSKDANIIDRAIKYIYQHDKYLEIPKVFQTDAGTEFKKLSFPSEHRIALVQDHRQMSLIERFHRTLENPIMNEQTRKEMEDVKNKTISMENHLKRRLTDEEFDDIFSSCVSRGWISMIDETVRKYNERIHSSIGISPLQAMQGKKPMNNSPEIPESARRIKFKMGDTVRLLNDTPDRGWRVGDPRWSFFEYTICYIKVGNSFEPPLYFVMDAKNYEEKRKGFYAEELQLVKIPSVVNLVPQKGSGVYDKVSNFIFDTSLRDGEIHPLLYVDGTFTNATYMGPGTHSIDRVREGVEPVCQSDKVAQKHDLAYALATTAEDVRKADKKW